MNRRRQPFTNREQQQQYRAQKIAEEGRLSHKELIRQDYSYGKKLCVSIFFLLSTTSLIFAFLSFFFNFMTVKILNLYRNSIVIAIAFLLTLTIL